MTELTKIKAHGPWLLVKAEEPQRMSAGGIYLPEGNLYERIGYSVVQVLSAGKGFWEPNKKTGKPVFIRVDVQPGDRIAIRGHLADANKVEGGGCFIHYNDLLGVLAPGVELSLCVPYDN